MPAYEPNSRHLREVLIFCFNMKKSAAEAHQMLSHTYDQHGGGREKVFEDAELDALLDQDSCQTQQELSGSLEVTQQAISKRLKVMEMIQKQGNWVPPLSDCQVIYSQFGLAIHQNDHQARSRFVEWAQNEITVVPDFHKRILFSDEAHFWLNGYVNKQNCRIWSEANLQVYVETPLHPEKLTVWCALWAGGILLQKR
ncbi:mariner Mos1 transposase [Trichonephila clavipes]|nr:mariner Mos1 transposase [Trichonephila clavipes]